MSEVIFLSFYHLPAQVPVVLGLPVGSYCLKNKDCLCNLANDYMLTRETVQVGK